jgi:hypothetical protein
MGVVLGPRSIKGFSSSQIILEEETPLIPPIDLPPKLVIELFKFELHTL